MLSRHEVTWLETNVSIPVCFGRDMHMSGTSGSSWTVSCWWGTTSHSYMSFLFIPAASSECDSPLSRRNRFSCSCTASSVTGSTTVTASSTMPAGSNSTISNPSWTQDTEVLPYLGQHSRRASLAPSSLPARVQDLPFRSELPGQHCPGLPPGTLHRSFLKRRPSEPSISESRGPCCSQSGYNSIWAARLLCVWAGHLEFPTAGGSTNHEQGWTVQEKVENILHAKATLTPLRIHIERVYLINQKKSICNGAVNKYK